MSLEHDFFKPLSHRIVTFPHQPTVCNLPLQTDLVPPTLCQGTLCQATLCWKTLGGGTYLVPPWRAPAHGGTGSRHFAGNHESIAHMSGGPRHGAPRTQHERKGLLVSTHPKTPRQKTHARGAPGILHRLVTETTNIMLRLLFPT